MGDLVKRNDVESWLQANTGKLRELLPKAMSVERSARLAIAAAMNPDLRACSAPTIVQCILDCAAHGLELMKGSAAIVPFKDKATLMIEYRGLLDIVHRCGNLEYVVSEVVYANDAFDWEIGDHSEIKHKPAPFGSPRGEMVGAYAIIGIRGGARVRCVMRAEEIMDVKRCARGSDSKSSPWNGPFEAEMWKKTVLRRACKLVPRSVAPEVAEAIAVEDEHYAGIRVFSAAPVAQATTETLTNRVQQAKRRGRHPKDEAPAPAEVETPPDEQPPMTEPDIPTEGETGTESDPAPVNGASGPRNSEDLMAACIKIWPARKSLGELAYKALTHGLTHSDADLERLNRRVQLLESECQRLKPDDARGVGALCEQIVKEA